MYFIVQRVRIIIIIIIIANKPTAKFMIFISEYKNVCDKISRFVFLITIIFLHFYCRLFALCEFVCVCVHSTFPWQSSSNSMRAKSRRWP